MTRCVHDGCRREGRAIRVRLQTGRELQTMPRCDEHQAHFIIEAGVKVIGVTPSADGAPLSEPRVDSASAAGVSGGWRPRGVLGGID